MRGRMAWPTSNRWRSPRRACIAWALAWLALLLNAIAPVIAYASIGVRHQHERPVAAPDAHDSGDHAHHSDSHAHHSDNHAITHAAPVQSTVAHCQYCFDFTAGAPLSIANPDVIGTSIAPA